MASRARPEKENEKEYEEEKKLEKDDTLILKWRADCNNMAVHIVPIRVYILVFIALLCLTAITAWVAYFDLGALNAVVALTIAVIKALLVILFFMHVKYSPPLTKLVIASGVIWLIILLTITLSDYLSRGWLQITGG